jgi:hypothetical protein
VRLTARELGFESGVTFAELVKKAAGTGLVVLPEDTAIHLCDVWDWVEWPRGSIVWVISKPIKIGSGLTCLLGVGRIWTGWLRARVVGRKTFFGPEEILVFGIHKNLHLYQYG